MGSPSIGSSHTTHYPSDESNVRAKQIKTSTALNLFYKRFYYYLAGDFFAKPTLHSNISKMLEQLEKNHIESEKIWKDGKYLWWTKLHLIIEIEFATRVQTENV